MRLRDGRPTGTETRYETGFYQIISCHTDDDAAAELTPGLAFPVNAAANQTRPQSPPFSSFRPATLTRRVSLFVSAPLRVVFVVRLYPSLRVHPSLFRRGSHPPYDSTYPSSFFLASLSPQPLFLCLCRLSRFVTYLAPTRRYGLSAS